MMSSRIVAAAVSHEVKNLSSAAFRVYKELASIPGLAESDDYAALGSLLDTMRKLASDELGPAVDDLKTGADLTTILQELLMILDPVLREAGIHFSHSVPAGLPRVHADHQGLLQVFLNLAQNSERALRNIPHKKISLEAYFRDGCVVIRFGNNGPTLEDPDRIFHPLQPKASATGLGMFISRAILRTYGGELQHVPQPEGCSFLLQIPALEAPRVQLSA